MFRQIAEFIRLSKRRKRSVQDYFNFQRFQAKIVINDLKNRYDFSKIHRIMDIGSGVGGYVYELAKTFPNKKIISLDKDPLKFARRKCKSLKNVSLVKGDATKMPFKNESFDLVLASSVIEHVKNQKLFINEIRRVLKKGSGCYISFPPFYSPRGGHSISPFHYLGRPFLEMYARYRVKKGKSDFLRRYDLVKTTLHSMKKLVKGKFEIIDIKPRLFTFLKPFLSIPLLNEFICHHVEFFLRKK